MEIGNYIGKFLLKNKYCSLPGLGVFELKKSSATYSSTQTEVENPSYIISFSPVGSIDDTFASFIASHENVSISNASNSIREFCNVVKEQVARSGSYDIEHLGKISMLNGKLWFKQNSDLDLGYTPVPVPTIEAAPRQTVTTATDYSYPPAPAAYPKRNKRSWPKYLMILLLLGGLGAGGYYGYKYWKKRGEANKNVTIEEFSPTEDSAYSTTVDSSMMMPNIQDTTADSNRILTPDSAVGAVQNPADSQGKKPAVTGPEEKNYEVVIMSTPNESVAKTRSNNLNRNGHKTQVVNRGGSFLVTISTIEPTKDTVALVDSIRRFFNPKGNVFILK